jgi:hypothetical protein
MCLIVRKTPQLGTAPPEPRWMNRKRLGELSAIQHNAVAAEANLSPFGGNATF